MTVRSATSRRRALGLTVLLLGAGATAACTAESGAAAVVEGEPIPVAELQDTVDQLGPLLDGATPASVLLVLVAEPVVDAVAAENGVAVSEQEAEQELAALVADSPDAPDFGPGAVSVARFSLLQQELGALPDADAVQEEILTRLEDLDIEVNPRYGELDLSRGGIAPIEHAWLVPQPEAEPEPEAEPQPEAP